MSRLMGAGEWRLASAPAITASQLERATLTLTRADNPMYVLNMLSISFDLADSQRTCLSGLARLEVERRAS